jgi:hypothetical protein
MRTIVVNANNLVPDGQNNKFIYNFPNSVQFKDTYIAVQSIQMYYSWYNISAALGNNVFTYTWYSGATLTTYTVTIPDGIYDVPALNAFLEYTMIQNRTYMTTASGSIVYFIQLEINVSRYAVQLCTFRVPSAGTNPSAFVPTSLGFPTLVFNPSVTFPANFNQIVGYPAGWASPQNIGGVVPPFNVTNSGIYLGVAYDYNATTGAMSFYSSSAPDITPNASVYLAVSNINNPYSLPSSIIYAISPSNGIGRVVIDKPPQFCWNQLINGTYNQLQITILGADLQPIRIGDPNMTFLFALKDKDEWGGK